jgi:hypothetical protein
VLAEEPLGPPALAVLDLVAASDHERADEVAALAGDDPLAEGQRK